MAVLSTPTKAKAGAKAVKGAAKNPGVLKVGAKSTSPVAKIGLKTGAPVAKRQARKRFESFGETARTVAEDLVTYGPSAAQELGLVDAPKPKRTAPRVAVGVVIGAGAVLLVEHREKLTG